MAGRSPNCPKRFSAHRFQNERRPPPGPVQAMPGRYPWTRPPGRPVSFQWEYNGEHGDCQTDAPPTAHGARALPPPPRPTGGEAGQATRHARILLGARVNGGEPERPAGRPGFAGLVQACPDVVPGHGQPADPFNSNGNTTESMGIAKPMLRPLPTALAHRHPRPGPPGARQARPPAMRAYFLRRLEFSRTPKPNYTLRM